jgi:carboxyl-terminal processing protease
MNFIAVIDFKCGKGIESDVCGSLTDVSISELVKIGKYTVIDRSNRDKILAEQGFQQSGCVEDKCMVEAGRLLGVGKIVVGSITKIGQTYLVNLQLINVQSASVDTTAEDECRCELEGLIQSVRNAARKLMGVVPASSGRTDGLKYVASVKTEQNLNSEGPDRGKLVRLISANYVEDVDTASFQSLSVDEIMASLDPHSQLLNKKQSQAITVNSQGKFGGIGTQISIRNGALTVMTPIEGTPASRARISSGDQIVTIDDKPTQGVSIDEAVSMLRGTPGSKVKLLLRRKGDDRDRLYTLTREEITVKSVPFAGMLENQIGYVRLLSFSQDAGAEIEKAMRNLALGNCRGLILDLRANPGGLLQQAIEVAGKLLPNKSLAISTRGRTAGADKEYSVTTDPVLPREVPLVVLVNNGSAAASEIVASAVQDWDRGLIIGDTTFGKGSVQTIYPLDDSYQLKLTTAYYFSPSGRCINTQKHASKQSAVLAAGKNAYRTHSGRIVYGQSGVVPDTVVKPAPMPLALDSLYRKSAIFDFANSEYPLIKNMDIQKEDNQKLNQILLSDFYSFASSMPGVKTIPQDILLGVLREALLVRAFGESSETVQRFRLARDVQVKTAMMVLGDKKTYKRFLNQ